MHHVLIWKLLTDKLTTLSLQTTYYDKHISFEHLNSCLLLLRQIEIFRTDISTPGHDHVTNYRDIIPSKQGYTTWGVGLGGAGAIYPNSPVSRP